MTLVHDRAVLDEYLEDVDLTLLIVIGLPDTIAEEIHDCSEAGVVEEWRVCLLMEDTWLLEDSELVEWELDDQRYVVLGVGDDDERVVAEKAENSALLRQDGKPSILRIRQAFTRGDLV